MHADISNISNKHNLKNCRFINMTKAQLFFWKTFLFHFSHTKHEIDKFYSVLIWKIRRI